MAYFPNGTAGDLFEAEECRDCIHNRDDGEGNPCSILAVHMLWNYDQIVDGERKNNLAYVLTELVDDSKPLGQMCSLRILGRWPKD